MVRIDNLDIMSSAHKRFVFVIFLIGIVASLLMVSGCGGLLGGGGGQSGSFKLTKTPVQAQITLPAGSPISNLSSLIPWSSGGATPLTADGKTNIVIFNNGPQYSDVRDAQKRLVLAGYLSSTNKVLNATSTAEAMVFFAIGGANQIGNGPAIVLAGIKSLPGFQDVVTEIDSQLVSQGYVSLQSGTLKAKIQVIIDAFGPLARQPKGTIADPTSKSGLFLDTIVDGQFTIRNNYLRRARGWLRKISYTDESGEHEAIGEYKKFDIASPSRYGGLNGTIAGIVTGNLTWTPTVSEPYAIPLDPPTALSTKYELRTFSLGANEGNLVSLTPEEQAESTEIVFKSLIMDAMLPVITGIILPLNGEAVDEFFSFVGASALLPDLINLAKDTIPQVYSQCSDGDLTGAIETLWTSGFTSNSAMPLLFQMAFSFAEKYGSQLAFDSAASASEAVSDRLSKLGYVDVFFSAADMAVFLHDFIASDRNDLFTIESTGGKVTLQADDPLVSVFDTTLVRAVIQNKDPNAIYRYQWSVSSGYKLTTSETNTDDAPNGVIDSFDDFARISTKTDEPGTALITCKVSKMDGENRTAIDGPTLKYRFVPATITTPDPASVKPTKTLTLTSTYSGEEKAYYQYTLIGSLGTINRTSLGDNPTVIFTAGSVTGSVDLKVEAFFNIGGTYKKFHTRTVPIAITNDTGVPIAPKYATYVMSTNNHLGQTIWYGEAAIYFDVPFEPGVTKYSIFWPPFPSFDHIVKQWFAGNPNVDNQHKTFVIRAGLPPTTSAIIRVQGSGGTAWFTQAEAAAATQAALANIKATYGQGVYTITKYY